MRTRGAGAAAAALLVVGSLTGCALAPDPPRYIPPSGSSEVPAGSERGSDPGSRSSTDRGSGSGRDEQEAAPSSSRSNPYPVGQPVVVGEWEVTVHAANLDAFEAVKAAERYAMEPTPGERYVMAPVDLKRLGEEASRPWVDLFPDFVGGDGITQSGSCGSVPDAMIHKKEMYQGATTTANMCLAVPEENIEGGVWVLSPFRNQAYFALS